MRGAGRALLAAVLLLIAGTLNIIYGIGALDDANIFVNDKRYIFTNLNTMGWVLIVLGVIQLAGGVSLLAGNTFGRVIGIIGGSLEAIGALLSVGGSYPWVVARHLRPARVRGPRPDRLRRGRGPREPEPGLRTDSASSSGGYATPSRGCDSGVGGRATFGPKRCFPMDARASSDPRMTVGFRPKQKYLTGSST